MSVRSRDALDVLAAGLLSALVLAAAAGSSGEAAVRSVGKPGREVILVALGLVALPSALRFRDQWRFRPWVAASLLAVVLFFFESQAWSVLPATTLRSSVAVAAIVVVAVLLAGNAAAEPGTGRRCLDGILVAAGVLALAGFVLWLVDPSSAVQSATAEYAARFEGLGENPDTAPMLLAVGMPLALARVLATGRRRTRIGALALLLAFAAEITASGSRGALLAGFLSMVVVLWFARLSMRGLVAGTLAVVASIALCAWVVTLPSALAASATPHVVQQTPGAIDAEQVLPLEQEVGSPWWTHHSQTLVRTLFSSGARVRALRGAVHQALGRPLVGTGFGAEVFVDRYYGFHSGNPENGYVGLFMQTGIVGLALFLGLLCVSVVPAFRRHVRSRLSADSFAPAALGAVAACLLLGLSQSYFHSAGNIVAVPFWIVLLMASAVPFAVEGAKSEPSL